VPNQTFILLDETTRALLGLEIGGKYQFEIVPAHWRGRIWWAYCASDPAARVATFIATWSLALAIIGGSLAVWSLYLSLKLRQLQ
jgi:hypothetical protein